MIGFLRARKPALGSAMLGLCLAIAACAPAPAAPGRSSDPGVGSAGVERAKVMTIAIPSEPSGFSDKLFQAASDIDNLFEASLTYLDGDDISRLLLAERTPSQADGTWAVNPDGTMRTVYTLKPDLKWQDGLPLTAEDFAFAYSVYADEELPVIRRFPEVLMSGVVARDGRTIEILWREPFAGAGSLGKRELVPLPRHLIGDLYAQDKGAFMNSSFWTSEEYVGSGAFRVANWERGVAITFAANPYFVMGKSPIDVLRLIFVADANTVAARMLAGAVDVFPTATTTMALTMKDLWQADSGGEVYITSLKTRRLYFQFRDVVSHQRALLDLRVRQALMHAIDRPALGAAVQGPLGPASDTAYPVGSSLHPRIDAVIAKYPFDATRAQALLRETGWAPGADGLLRDGSGRTLDVEVRTTEGQDAQIIADYWRQIGVNGMPVILTGVQRRDDEFRVNFPATQLQGGSGGYLTDLYTQNAPSPANRFRGSNNRGTYSNPEYDRAYRLQLATLDPAARNELLVELERIITHDVAVGYVIYDAAPMVARSMIKGIKNVAKEQGNPFWNIWEWKVEEGR